MSEENQNQNAPETQNQTPETPQKPSGQNAPPRSPDLVHSDAKTMRDLQTRLSTAEKRNQDLSGELNDLRTIVAQLGKIPAKDPTPKRKTLLDEVSEIVFGPTKQD